MTPLVSILIPVYNAEQWLASTLRSTLAQDYVNIEVIVVDDGSTDRSLEIADAFRADKLKVFSRRNGGAAAARNFAFIQSKGSLIQYLDADDLLHPAKISTQVQMLSRAADTDVASSAWARFRREPLEAQLVPHQDWRDLDPIEWLFLAWGGGCGTMPIHSWLTPRALISKAGPWDESLNLLDDGEFFARVLLNSTRVRFCNEAVAYYRSGVGETLSKRNDHAAFVSWFRALNLTRARVLQVEDSPRMKRAFANVYRAFMYSAYPDVPDLVRSAEAAIELLGGCDPLRKGDIKFRILCGLFGWKLTRRLQHAYRGLRNNTAFQKTN